MRSAKAVQTSCSPWQESQVLSPRTANAVLAVALLSGRSGALAALSPLSRGALGLRV